MDKEQFLHVYRHSLAHVLAKAVIEVFGKETQYAIGPEIADGFYYDFLLPRAATNDDLKTIEEKMKEILKRKEDWKREEISKKDALELFKNQKFKVELIEDLPDDEILTTYRTGDDFVDLCRGPHVENSAALLSVAWQLRSMSGSYWRGDEKRDQLTRIYAYAFPTKEELKAHLAFIKDAQERDHKKIGPQLDLFMFDETAPGMPYWLPRGWKLFNALLEFWRGIHEAHGYQEVSAPVINNKRLWVTSGHWAHYKENMFLIPGADGDIEADDTFAIKPMNCPNAIKIYQRKTRSYRDLPIRYNTVDVIHRKEKSGELNGLFRVQLFRQDDDHTFLMEDQIAAEMGDIMDIADEIYSTLGMSCKAELSTRPDDFMGDIETWNIAEKELKEILDRKYGEGNYEVNEGDGAFYGPKIDFHLRDSIGRTWQCGTIQLDMSLPEKFDLTYVGEDGEKHRPVMLHRVVYGSIERFIGILIENYAGAFPVWMAPVQVRILPITERHAAYAEELYKKMFDLGLRVEVDARNEKTGYKIRESQVKKTPYTLVVGDQEMENGTVAFRKYGEKDSTVLPVADFIALVQEKIATRALEY